MEITFVKADDWEGLFVDGVLYIEGHQIRVEDVLDMLVESGQVVDSYESKEVAYAWLEEEGGVFPSSLNRVVFVD